MLTLVLFLSLFTNFAVAGYETDCKVSAGSITGCYGSPYYGDLSVAFNPSSGLYETNCKVSAGKIMGCYGSPYYGDLTVANK